jgi:hypothetical protein
MENRPQRVQPLSLIVGGLGVVVVAVLLFGLETDGGEPDWISIIMALAGAVMVVTGLIVAFRNRGRPTGSKPHTAS